MKYLALLFLFVLFPHFVAAQSNDAALVRQIAEEFFETYPTKNFEKMRSLWSESSPDREKFLKQFQFGLKDTGNISITDFVVKKSLLEDDKFVLQVSLTMSATDTKTKHSKWNFGKWNQTLRLVKENDLWKIRQCKFAEVEFAEQLANAPTAVKQDALISENPELINRYLRRAIVDLNRNLRARNEIGKVIFLTEMMERLADISRDEIWLARAWFSRGAIFYHLSEQGKADEFYLKSEKLSSKLNDEEGLVLVWHSLGLLRGIQSEVAQARNYYSKAAELAEKIGDFQTFLRLRNNQGVSFFINAGFDSQTDGNNFYKIKFPEKPLREALIYFEQIRDINDQLGETQSKAVAIANIGEAYLYLHEYENALNNYNEALDIAKKNGIDSLRDGILSSVCLVYIGQNRLAEAGELIEKLLVSSNPNNLESEFFQMELMAADLFHGLGQNDKAEKYFLSVIEKYENQRKQISNTLTRQRFLVRRVFPYYEMAILRAEQNRREESLQYAEMIKARILFDIARSGAKFSEKSLTGSEKGNSEKLKVDIENLNRQVIEERVKAKPDERKIGQLNDALMRARIDYEKFQSYLFSVHPEMNLQRGEIPLLKLSEIENLVPDAQTAIVEYAVTDEKVLVFVLTKTEKLELEVYQLPIPRRELVPKARDFRRQIADQSFGYKAQASEFYQILIQPLAKHLKNRKNLIIVPDGILWELPFQALISPENKYLIEDYAISYAPSLSVLNEMSKAKSNPSPANLLAFGNPALNTETIEIAKKRKRGFNFEPLPEAETEVKKIASLYGINQNRLFIGNKASEQTFKLNSDKFRVLHFATHAVADNENPMYSFLVFSQIDGEKDDGILEAWEIMQMNLHADLAVLSACETARGQIGEGEGIIGLSWAFFVAGVPTTVVSQWNVESKSTSDLMVNFHRNLRLNRSKAKALQLATISLLKNRATNHPYFWAGFVLVGNVKK